LSVALLLNLLRCFRYSLAAGSRMSARSSSSNGVAASSSAGDVPRPPPRRRAASVAGQQQQPQQRLDYNNGHAPRRSLAAVVSQPDNRTRGQGGKGMSGLRFWVVHFLIKVLLFFLMVFFPVNLIVAGHRNKIKKTAATKLSCYFIYFFFKVL